MKLHDETTAVGLSADRWQREAVAAFQEKMTNTSKPFPCIPATQAQAMGHLRYAFAGDPRGERSTEQLAEALRVFTAQARTFGKYATLIAFFETPASLREQSVEMFEALFWKQLNGLADRDERNWPERLPTSPEEPAWEFCFHGEPYFMYCATPAHRNRLSRNFPCFMLAITPRWVLQGFNANASAAVKMKNRIRERLERYDDAPPHPQLRTYGADDNFEWKQYFLRDDESSLPKCPFLRAQRLKDLDPHA
ncbi:YqcI/YcgG family protein [Paenibacillus sp. TRM 82003]|nr:YqcI/YcgG family protein [Paenibacillus sp. TRM 82003]